MNRVLLVTLLLLGALESGAADPYPAKPIKLVAPAPPGSPVDVRARWVAEKLAPALGQPIIVDNRAGAGGNIGMELAAKSAADGYTLVIVHHGTMAVNPHLYARSGYDPIRDFTPVTRLLDSVLMLAVNPALPAQSVDELIKLAKARPGQLSYGSSGIGTPPHMAAELFRRIAGIDVQHVPYKGASPALTDLVAGRLAFTIDSLTMQMPQVKLGKVRALATTGPNRVAAAPDVPTFAEAGLADYEYRSWMGVAMPAGAPGAVTERLNAELVRTLKTAEAREWFAAQGAEAIGDAPHEFAALIRSEYARWGRIIRESGIKAE